MEVRRRVVAVVHVDGDSVKCRDTRQSSPPRSNLQGPPVKDLTSPSNFAIGPEMIVSRLAALQSLAQKSASLRGQRELKWGIVSAANSAPFPPTRNIRMARIAPNPCDSLTRMARQLATILALLAPGQAESGAALLANHEVGQDRPLPGVRRRRRTKIASPQKTCRWQREGAAQRASGQHAGPERA
jgi:hypothetical protein